MKKLLHFSLFIFVWFSVSIVSAQNETRGSLLYKITGNGLSKPSYLYGTMHVSDRMAFRLPDTFFDAIESVDMVALEINPDSMLSALLNTFLNAAPAEEIASDAPSYYGRQGNFYKNMSVTESFDEDYFRKLLVSTDDISNVLMFRSSFSGHEYEESTYLDLFIFQSGKKLKKKISGVEDYAESFRLEMLSYKEDMQNRDYYDRDNDAPSIDEIESAYRRQDINRIDSLSRLSMSENRYKYFIVARNKNQADSLDALMRENSVFCGVGAGHLGGDSGVVNLLRQKGYTVEPVIDKLTKSGENKKKKFEKLEYPLTYKPFAPADSVFSVSMPGHVYTLSEEGSRTMFFTPDMVNGGSYEVYRIRPGDFFSGRSNDQLLKLQDSLLFECVPGEIVQQNKISASNGFKGIDVITKVRDGKSMHAQLFTTGREIIIFKVSGLQGYAQSKNAKTFFSSIKFAPASSETITTLVDSALGIKVDLPDNRIADRKFNQYPVSEMSEALNVEAYDKGGDRRYKLIVSVYNDISYLEEDTFELEAIIKEFFENEKTDTFTIKQVTAQPFPVAEGYASKKGRHYFVRTTLNNNRYVTLAVSSKDSVFPTAFFNSFQWIGYLTDKAFTQYTDSSMYFKTLSFPQIKKEQSEFVIGMMELLMGYYEEETANNELSGSYSTKIFSSTISPEYATVTFQRCSRYLYLDTTLKSTLDPSIGYESMKCNFTRKQVSPDRLDLLVTYTDTASSRCIYVKHIIQGGCQYTVSILADSASGLTGWSKAFFDNFEPLDTVIGMSVFQPKNMLYLEDLSSEDSTRRDMAEHVMGGFLEIDNACETQLMKLLQSERFQKLETSEKSQVLNNVSCITSKAFTDEVVKLYKVSVDSTDLQQSILRVLCRQKTQYAYDAFMKLLEYDTPLYESAGQLVLCHSALFDSLKLTATLFPAILNYTKYPEYKKSVYVLLNTLLDSNLIDPKILQNHFKTIIADALEEQKRFKTSGVIDNCYCEQEVMPTYGSEVHTDDFIFEPMGSRNAKDNYSSAPTHELLMGILAKSYKFHSDIPAFFNRTLESKNAVLLTSAVMMLDKNNIPVKDTMWTHLSRDPFVAGEIYALLKKKNALHLFDSACLNQMFFATAAVKNVSESSDSVVFLKKVRVDFKGHSGYMYFFKRGNSDDGWRLATTGPFPLDDSIITDPLITEAYLSRISKDDDGLDTIEQYCKDLYYYGRPRSGWSGFNYYDYGYDY